MIERKFPISKIRVVVKLDFASKRPKTSVDQKPIPSKNLNNV